MSLGQYVPALIIVSAVGAGVIAGVFFAFSSFVMGALARLPTAEGVRAMQSINVVVLNRWFLGAFVGTLVLLGLLAAVSGFGTESSASAVRLRVAAAVAYLVGTVGVTRAFNIPRNDALDRVAADGPEAAAFWPRYVREWTWWNHVRTAASALASALVVASQ